MAASLPTAQSAVSTSQYRLQNSDGVTWQEIDAARLRIIISTTANQSTLLTANADLFTGNAGYNQDLGIFVSDNNGTDQLIAWKESGGFAGTYSPNAAFVQYLYSLTSGHTYVFKLKWKTNINAPASTIYAGAGPGGGPNSPTSLIAKTYPTGTAPNFSFSTSQFTLSNSDGVTWRNVDLANLATTLTPTVNSTAVLGANADLFTANAGYNQDLGIFVSDNGSADQLVAWKESGGFAGTFSPNAAFVKATYAMSGGHSYAFSLKWKTNISAPGTTIYAGAGPGGGPNSPTTLVAESVPSGSNVYAAASTSQFNLGNSDGAAWQPVSAALDVTVLPAVDSNSIVGANADLFTASAGYNQDIGIFVSDNGGSDSLVAWKESGGFAGSYSPNAAFAQMTYPLAASHMYVFKLKMKTNINAPGSTIYAGAGSGGGPNSPTRLTVEITTPSGGPPRQLSFLHVGPVSGPSMLPQVVDQFGREVLLKGVNIDGTTDYWLNPPTLPTPYPIDVSQYAPGHCPPDQPNVEGVMLCDYDFDQLRPLGYNVIRLDLSWSLLEPTPGNINQAYVDRIAQVVDWAKAQGIYIVLDMHQDAWSKYLYSGPNEACTGDFQRIRGYDGAPLWASSHTSPVCALHGVRELDPAVQEDFTKLYNDVAAPDGIGLQEHYGSVMAALALRFHNDPTVAGYEVINEPSPGYGGGPTPVSDAVQLFPFYAKVVAAMIQAVPSLQQLVFIEPNVSRDVTDFSAIQTPWSAFSSYPNVVYAPHVYTGVFTADQTVASTRFFPSAGGYNSAIMDARALGLPLWIGEFGNSPGDDETLLRTSLQLQDQDQVPGALWLWKENANDTNGAVFWGLYGKPFDQTTHGVPQLGRLKFMDRAFPLYTAGHLQTFAYNPDVPGFDLQAGLPPAPASVNPTTCTPVGFGDHSRATVIFVPAAVTTGIGATGAQLEIFERADGSREVYVYPSDSIYHVFSGNPAATPAGVTCTGPSNG